MNPTSRASAIPRELACPGSPLVIARVGERKGDEGLEGEWLHYEVATRLVDEMGATPPEGGLKAPKLPASFKVPRHSLWIVDWCVRQVRDLVPADWSLMVEVEMEGEFARWELTGHADWIAISPDGKQFIGADWKTGYEGVAPAEENDQALSYIVLVKMNWPSVESGSFYMFQPRLSEEESEHPRVSFVALAGTDLELCVASLDARKCAALDNAMRLVDGPQCKWCVGLRCPCLQKELDFMEMELTPELLDGLNAEPDDAKIAEMQFVSRILAKPMEDLKKLVVERIDKMGYIAGPDGRQITRTVQGAGITVTDPVNYARVVREMIPDQDKLAVATRFALEPLVHLIAEQTGAPKGGKSGGSARDMLDVRTSPFFEPKTKNVLKYSL